MEEYNTVREILEQAGPYISVGYFAAAAPFMVYAIRKAMAKQNERTGRIRILDARRNELEANFESRHGKKATLTNAIDSLVKRCSDL